MEKLDPPIPIHGRFDKKIFIGPPDLEARVGLFKLYMVDRPQEKIDWLDVAEKCEYYTCGMSMGTILYCPVKRKINIRNIN